MPYSTTDPPLPLPWQRRLGRRAQAARPPARPKWGCHLRSDWKRPCPPRQRLHPSPSTAKARPLFQPSSVTAVTVTFRAILYVLAATDHRSGQSHRHGLCVPHLQVAIQRRWRSLNPHMLCMPARPMVVGATVLLPYKHSKAAPVPQRRLPRSRVRGCCVQMSPLSSISTAWRGAKCGGTWTRH